MGLKYYYFTLNFVDQQLEIARRKKIGFTTHVTVELTYYILLYNYITQTCVKLFHLFEVTNFSRQISADYFES